MSPLQHHHIVSEDGQQSLTIFPSDGAPIIVTGDHPRFDAILEGARNGEPAENLRELADVSVAIKRYMEPLSERVSVSTGRVYVDGDELDTSLTQHIVRVLEAEGPSSDGLRALVSFLEKLLQNPSKLAQETLYDWLSSRPFTITADGDLIAYKGVDSAPPEAEHEFESCFNGPAIVNGIEYDPEDGDGVPQSVGDFIELPRSEVDPDQYIACSHGLHVGTYEFARSYGDALLMVVVNPRDVVGVPTRTLAEKVRVCRYRITQNDAVEFDRPVITL